MHRRPSAARILCSGIFLALAAGSSVHAKGWLTFDVPGSTSITPTAMSDHNTIFGYYANPDSTYGSFVRTSDGTVSTFNLTKDGSTKALSANAAGDIAGTVFDNGTSQAFLRTADGQATLFSINGSSFTEAKTVNDNDWFAGDYIDPSTSKQVGYIHRPNGKVETITSPDGSALTVNAINNKNIVIGTYGTHGYFRDAQGNMTMMRITANYVVPVAINADGTIAGYYADTNGKIHGFIRHTDGSIKGFNPSIYNGILQVTGMNDSGIVVGWSTDTQNIPHGFAVSAGQFATLDAPNGVNGTQVLAVEKAGKMAGIYFDENNASHGVRINAAQTGF